MKLAYLCPVMLGGIVVVSTVLANDLSLSSPENAPADSPSNTSSGAHQAAKPPVGVNIDLLPEMEPDEVCDENITGQFWYKVCLPVKKKVKEIRYRKEWKICWVYDPINCCNVAKKTQIDVPYEVEIEQTSKKEELRCVTIEIPFEKIKGLPSCQCDDVPVPFTMSPGAKPSSPSPAQRNQLLDRTEASMVALKAEPTQDQPSRQSLAWLPKPGAKPLAEAESNESKVKDVREYRFTSAPTRVKFTPVFVQRSK